MINFALTAEQRTWQKKVRTWARTRLEPGAFARESQGDISHELIREMGGLGLLGVNVPQEYGGLGAGVIAYALALREVAAIDGSVAVTMAVTNMVAEVLTAFAKPEAAAAHIGQLTSGAYFGGAFALSEPAHGSDAAGLQSRAVRDGDGWVLRGEKMWITTGDRAGVMVVWARTGEEGPKGLSAFLVKGTAPGLVAGKPEPKMGLKASHTVSLTLQDVRVPNAALLGREGDGFKIAMMALDGGRIGISSQSCGYAFCALEEALQCVQEQSMSRAPSAMQGMHLKLADMATGNDAAWLMTLRAAYLKERGDRFSSEAAMAKLLASENSNQVLLWAGNIVAEGGGA